MTEESLMEMSEKESSLWNKEAGKIKVWLLITDKSETDTSPSLDKKILLYEFSQGKFPNKGIRGVVLENTAPNAQLRDKYTIMFRTYYPINGMLGKILSLLDASIVDDEQRESLKKMCKQLVWDNHDYVIDYTRNKFFLSQEIKR